MKNIDEIEYFSHDVYSKVVARLTLVYGVIGVLVGLAVGALTWLGYGNLTEIADNAQKDLVAVREAQTEIDLFRTELDVTEQRVQKLLSTANEIVTTLDMNEERRKLDNLRAEFNRQLGSISTHINRLNTTEDKLDAKIDSARTGLSNLVRTELKAGLERVSTEGKELQQTIATEQREFEKGINEKVTTASKNASTAKAEAEKWASVADVLIHTASIVLHENVNRGARVAFEDGLALDLYLTDIDAKKSMGVIGFRVEQPGTQQPYLPPTNLNVGQSKTFDVGQGDVTVTVRWVFDANNVIDMVGLDMEWRRDPRFLGIF